MEKLTVPVLAVALVVLGALALGVLPLRVEIARPGDEPGYGRRDVGQVQGESGPAAGGLSIETVRSWCSGTHCDADRFEQTIEGNGVVNPNSVHFETGQPASFRLPDGVYLQNWDCFTYTTIDGPASETTTCEGTFRLS